MLKRIGFVCVILILLVGFSSNASALSLFGSVNPVFFTNTTGIATYRFDVGGGAGEGLYGFSMAFPGLGLNPGLAFSSISGFSPIVSPLGWSGGIFGGTNVLYTGSISAGNTFSFSINFELSGLGRIDPDFSTTTFWPEGGPWQQSFGAGGFGDPANPFPGGSTALAPEPGTLMLLGWGLISTGVVSRFRRKRRLSKTS